MTEDERTALIHQINRHAHLSSHQMEAVMGALHHLKWGPTVNKNSDLMSTAPLPNYNVPIIGRCEPLEGTKEGTYHVLTNGGTKKMGKWENQRWYIPGQNSQTAGEAGRDGWRYNHAVQIEPPVPDPHAALRDAVVEAAMAAYYNGWLLRHIDDVSKSCAALAVAQATQEPPAWVPVAEVPEAWKDGRELIARFHGANPCPCVIVEYTQSSGTWCGDNGDVVVSHLCDCIPRREP